MELCANQHCSRTHQVAVCSIGIDLTRYSSIEIQQHQDLDMEDGHCSQLGAGRSIRHLLFAPYGWPSQCHRGGRVLSDPPALDPELPNNLQQVSCAFKQLCGESVLGVRGCRLVVCKYLGVAKLVTDTRAKLPFESPSPKSTGAHLVPKTDLQIQTLLQRGARVCPKKPLLSSPTGLKPPAHLIPSE